MILKCDQENAIVALQQAINRTKAARNRFQQSVDHRTALVEKAKRATEALDKAAAEVLAAEEDEAVLLKTRLPPTSPSPSATRTLELTDIIDGVGFELSADALLNVPGAEAIPAETKQEIQDFCGKTNGFVFPVHERAGG